MRRTYFLAIVLAACSHKPAEPSSPGASERSVEPAASATSAMAARSGALPSAAPSSATSNPDTDGGPDGGLTAELALLWNEPATFVRVGPKNSARVADYVVPHADKDTEDAECVVMTFGRRHGGTVDENVKRWIDQFHPALTTPRRMNDDVNGMHVTFIEVAGTFIGNMPPSRQGVSTPAGKPAWRLIGAIVQAPSGLWFFKLTGPDLTVRIASRPFEDMVRSARPR
jgi:hypothetical protein